MNLVIVEDESIAARRIQKMVQALEPGSNVLAVLDSVAGVVKWLQQHPAPDLLLLDIELVDGQSFEIFTQVEVTCPVIFTTAYDEYAIRAFKVNSIDYLLKPIQEKELQQSLQKFRNLKKVFAGTEPVLVNIELLLQELQQQRNHTVSSRRDRILVKQGQRMLPLTTTEAAYFFTRDKLNYVRTRSNQQYLLDYTLDELEKSLNPKNFFRANRQYIIEFSSVVRVHQYFNSKLKVELTPKPEEDVVISREKAADFRHWLGE
ncbi:LytTR family DNA-binding domain-containing protein [Cesiribacter sp. SM1]|uniref:LytR/AlgR family response regulator transcription factor n=1 Tax=Cesiribacter sp. SM1 TaxID=2861196 RepID=UPI001CD63437|nr:LytTR family DNA-binding domain-containing protein [Cesiribacter sp. SM1]